MSELEDTVTNWLREVIDLRHGEAGDPDGKLKAVSIEDGLSTVAYELTRVRKRSDRIDYIRTQVSLVRSRLKAAKSSSDFQADAKFMEATSHRDRNKAEFASSLSVKANATLDSFEEKRAAHEATMQLELVSDAYYIIDQISRQMDSIRNDIRAILRSLQFESSLEH